MLLELQLVNAFYDSIHVIRDVSFTVEEGDLVSIIGANGAGKSTLLRTIAGFVEKKSGSIKFNGKEISNETPDAIVRLGISCVWGGKQIFRPLTVVDNLRLGAYVYYSRKNLGKIRNRMKFVFDLFPVLKDREKQAAGTLSGGEQQMLAIGRALMAEPDLLILDEPSTGLAPIVVTEIFDVLKKIQDDEKSNRSIVLVEQNALAAFQIARYGYVLESGRIMLEGETKELMNNEKVKQLYLGL